MKIERVKNTRRNILTGTIMKIFTMLMPFVMRTLMIYFMGEEYLGLNSLFTSVLHVLNLAELGIGSAMVFSMYKPISEDDHETLCALMKLYRTYYRIIGLVVGGLGLILLPFIPQLIKGSTPEGINVYILYAMNLAATVLSYWMFAYRSSLLSAHQRIDIKNLIHLAGQILQYGLQLVIILWLKDYYLYVAAILVCQILCNISSAVASKRMFPQYDPKGDLPAKTRKDINHRIRDLFISKLGGVVLGSADTIVISAFLGLAILARYQNYFFILTSVCGFMEVLLEAMLAGIGNSLVTEDHEKNMNDFRRITILFTWVTFTCVCCFSGLFQPFMKLWMGTELMLQNGMVLSFCVYFAVYEYTRLFNTFKNAAGEWHKDRFRPLISAILNLCLNLIMVQFWGLYGILWSSIIALAVVELPWLLHNLFTTIYKEASLKAFCMMLLPYLLGGCLCVVLTWFITNLITIADIPRILCCGVISAVIPLVGFMLLFRKQSGFHDAIDLLDRTTRGKLHLSKFVR